MADALRVVEFYSGIGGARVGVERWAAQRRRAVVTVAAYDMNAQANAVYQKNFGLKPSTRGIEHLKVEELNRHRADVWLMSPPCQPFTPGGGRGGKAGGDDRRTDSFHHLTAMLRRSCADGEGGAAPPAPAPAPLAKLPTYVLLENVVGFGRSDAAAGFIATLRQLGYDVREYAASPAALGIPYERARYYVLARRDGVAVPAGGHGWCIQGGQPSAPAPPPPPSLSAFFAAAGVAMDAADGDDALAVPQATFAAHPTYRFDVVSRSGSEAACVTKGYGKSHKGTGSMVVVEKGARDDDDDDDSGMHAALQALLAPAGGGGEDALEEPALKRLKTDADAIPTPSDARHVKHSGSARRMWISGAALAASALRLRWLSPAEVAALHGYPAGFDLSPAAGAVAKWRLLGNSLSCDVHCVLAGWLLDGPSDPP